MEFKKILTMMMAAVAVVFAVCSCGSDDDAPEAALATQVIGSYTGNEVVSVMGEESSNGSATYEFAKSSDISIDMTIPESGEMGHMTIPRLVVKNIPLTKGNSTITGKLASFAGKVTGSDGAEKAYTVNDLTVIFNEKNVVVTFSLMYGNMPFAMVTNFTGTRK